MDLKLLEKTLEEEKETDQKLTQLAEDVNVEAKEIESGESEERKAPRGKARPFGPGGSKRFVRLNGR